MFHSLVLAKSTCIKWLRLGLVVIFLFSTFGLSGAAPAAAYPLDSDTFVMATNGDVDTLDPALAYDTSSGEVIQNVYETLVFYNGADASSFVPQLASSYELSADGLTWTFHIRPGVSFHDGADLSASDVAYSFQRGLLQGGSNSPQWLLTEAFFGLGITDVSVLVDPNGSLMDDRAELSAWDAAELVAACERVKTAVVADDIAGTVTMHLAQKWEPFFATIASSWGSILDEDWAVANGAWDGSCDTWQGYYATDSANDPLTGIANGTGPFVLDHWTPGTETLLTRNASYWRTPARLQRVKIQVVSDSATRYSMLQSGSADQAQLNSSYISQADGLMGEDCVWNTGTNQFGCVLKNDLKYLRRYIGRPGLSQDAGLFNFNITNPVEGNPYIGSGVLDGDGIPTDFFADVHIRKAFNYCFNWSAFSQQAWGGGFSQAPTLPLPGMPGYDLNAPHYSLDLAKCAEEFGLADLDKDGTASLDDTDDVTQLGFKMKLVYNEGNLPRQKLAEILSANLAQVNSKFVTTVVGLPWSDYQTAMNANLFPFRVGGWMEDIHDPHNWYFPYLLGTYANRSNLPDSLRNQYKTLVDEGVAAVGFAARHAIYQQLNQLVYDTAPFLLLGGATSRSYVQRRVQGQVLNPIFPGNYYYPIYIFKPTVTGSLGKDGAGATVSFTGGVAVKANSLGAYTIRVPYGWSGSITPSKVNFSFSPASRSLVNVRSNKTAQNFSTIVQMTGYSVGLQDGWILESGENTTLGGAFNSTAPTLLVGDAVADKQYRSILSFDTTALPDDAVIVSATLKLMKQSLVGTNPFTTHQGLAFDIRKPFFGVSVSLAAADFQALPSLLNAGTFSSVPVGNWYSATLSTTARGLINKTGATQFRLRFVRDDNDDNGNDYLAFYSGNFATIASRPTLVIKYYRP